MRITIGIVLSVVGAMAASGCGKDEGYSSFELTPSVNSTDGRKADWSGNGLFWHTGDQVSINGYTHTVNISGSLWITTGVHVNAEDDGNFYIAFPSGSGYSSSSHTVGGISITGNVVPLSCVGSTNKLTLYPCCAVLKLEGMGGDATVELTDEPYGSPVMVPTSGSIDIAGNCITGGSDYENVLSGVEVGGSTYVVVPMTGNSLRAALTIFDENYYGETTEAVTLRKGYLYIIDPANF